mmetsp:Transcript_22666/g.25795  ORF Transcript_22666/g.25795 Transcript_22666/m.25795 type:complete len:283 (-) Transcript_22666:27-875(-)
MEDLPSSLCAIIFDLDGTILDTNEELCAAIATATNKILPNLEILLQPEDINSKYPYLIGATLKEFYDALISPHLNSKEEIKHSCNNNNNGDNRSINVSDTKKEDSSSSSLNTFINLFLEAVKDQNKSCPPFPDVVKALVNFRSKYPSIPFGIATTKPTNTAEADLAFKIDNASSSTTTHDASLRSLFKHVQGTDEGIKPKPNPDVILRCASIMKVDIKNTIYIGDTARDALAAKAAGCMGCFTVRRENGVNKDNLGANALITSFVEIEEAVMTLLHTLGNSK